MTNKFPYHPGEHELEKASNSYLMSVIAIMAGAPLPIINLLASFIFFLGNRKGSYFVRWHCLQALLSQLSLFFINSFGFWWTISILFNTQEVSNPYISYLFTIIIFNIIEFVCTIHAAVQTRKGIHVSWWFVGGVTNMLCRP